MIKPNVSLKLLACANYSFRYNLNTAECKVVIYTSNGHGATIVMSNFTIVMSETMAFISP